MSAFYITTPIYYVNAAPHLGHAYTTIVADAVARFRRLRGDEVFFLTGTDEHGDKIVEAAEKNGLSPKEYVDRISMVFKNLWPELQIENSAFIRTTDENHKNVVREVLQKVYDSGDIYFDEYGGHYCFGCERFYTEKELVNGLCPDHKTAPKFIMEKNYFFRMSKYLGPLKEFVEKNPDFIRPERYRNEVLGLLREDLGDLCISRPKSRLTWGIELPFDSNFVCYVWFDALINYITALGWPDGENFAKYWPGANHLVAKDILKPHAIFWPTMLMAAGIPLYKGLRVHGYWMVDEAKMSKSLGNVVEPLSMRDKYGLDAFRFFLLREMRFGNDASFSEHALVDRLNADLANDLGNLFNRAQAMTHKYFGGAIPKPDTPGAEEEVLRVLALESVANFQSLFTSFRFAEALESLWEFVRHLNKYIDTSAPWTLYKNSETGKLGTVIYYILEGLRKVAVHLWPVMPGKSLEMLTQLGLELNIPEVDLGDETKSFGLLKPEGAVLPPANLFPRVDTKAMAAASENEEKSAGKKAKSEAAPKAAQAAGDPACGNKCPVESAGAAEMIEFDDFRKVDLRVGRIVKAEPVPKADKLLLLQVDLGEPAPRQIVAGIAEFHSPETLIGRMVTVVANLKPRKLRGTTSEGMVLAVRRENGLELLTPTGEVAPGAKVS